MSTKPMLLGWPGKIGTMELKNRLVIPAMCTNYTFQGHLTDKVGNAMTSVASAYDTALKI